MVRGVAARVGRVGQVPAVDPGLVDPGGQHRAAVRRPPVAAEPAELLGRDELGEPPGRCRSSPAIRVSPSGALGHPQRAVAARSRRRRSGGRSGRAAGRSRRRPPRTRVTVAGAQVGPEQAATERERGDGRVAGRCRTSRCRRRTAGCARAAPARPAVSSSVCAVRAARPGRRSAARCRSRRRRRRAGRPGPPGRPERRKTTRAPSAPTVTARGAP